MTDYAKLLAITAKPGQFVACVVSNHQRAAAAWQAILDLLPERDDYSISPSARLVRFENGSKLKVVTATDQLRGHSLDAVCIDESVSADYFKNVIKPCLVTRKGYVFR